MEKQNVVFKKMYYGFPIYLVSFYDSNGPNLSTMSSSFSLGDMIVLGFSKTSYSIEVIKEVKEFVINIPDRELIKQIELAGSVSGRNSNKFELCNFTPKKSAKINAPIIEECSIAIECVADQIIESPNNPNYSIVIASIVGRLVNKNLLNEEDNLNASLVDPVLYLGDDKMRYYRYLEKEKVDTLWSFIR